MSVHRWTGRALILVAVGASPGFFSLILNFRASKIVQYAEFPIPFMIVYFGLNGWRQVRNKEIQAHRASMIMFSGCFFYFAVQVSLAAEQEPLFLSCFLDLCLFLALPFCSNSSLS